MSLDPIVSLSVAIAEGPGSYAFFLGSGVSRDAGVPTGSDVFWQAVSELYRVEKSTRDTPDENGLREWLGNADRADLSYSDLLELIAPDPAIRRDNLAKHFEGVEPGPSHERLADLAKRGLVTVFVTTNFDRLLERALQSRGLEPIVITSPDDLERAPSREHAACYVLKPHGDYLQQTIRNTPSEVAELDSAVAAEVKEILDRYGVVVLGYSGSDEGIVAHMRARQSRYGLYWVARDPEAQPARSIVEGADGRIIVRESAEGFLSDLDRRLAAFQAQPSGLTPLTVNDETITLLRRGDRVGLCESLRGERREFEDRFSALIRGRHQQLPHDQIARDCHRDLLPVLERRLASALPLVLHDADLFGEEVESLADFKCRQEVVGGYTFWAELLDWVVWWLGFVAGAFAIRERRFAALGPLLTVQARRRYEGTEPLIQSIPGGAGHGIGVALMAEIDERSYFAPAYEALKLSLANLELLRERYPELIRSDGEPTRSLAQFDFLLSIALGVHSHGAVSHWTMSSEAAEDLARRLHGNQQTRTAIAEAIGLTLEEFDEKAPDALRSARALGNFPDLDAITILETGSRQ